MRIITKKHLPRRTFLRGLGVTMSLPLLDSMIPAQTPLLKTAAYPQIRLGLCFYSGTAASWPIGLLPRREPSSYRERSCRSNRLEIRLSWSATSHTPWLRLRDPGDNGGDHTRSPAVFLNGVHPKRTDGADIHAGVTIDQIAAAKIGQDTPLPSLELATEDYSGLVGSCDVGFSCAYMNTISWRTPTTPLPMEINPRLVFDRMFGDGATSAERLERIEQQRSILDAVTSQVASSPGRTGRE